MTRPDSDSDPGSNDTTADATITVDDTPADDARRAPGYDPPYPRRERFDTRLDIYEDDHGEVGVIDDPSRRGAWLLSTRFVEIER
jgi:hypothetical protein